MNLEETFHVGGVSSTMLPRCSTTARKMLNLFNRYGWAPQVNVTSIHSLSLLPIPIPNPTCHACLHIIDNL